ncbi:dual 3',5'-cyclic-AMP and -GMP phosphodiesterase 11 [Trichonephila clavipes]|nr:dual 3',5'-cyclic-AMP and -GMP phosphodiesterase 11 [Trichonephila clavipes]
MCGVEILRVSRQLKCCSCSGIANLDGTLYQSSLGAFASGLLTFCGSLLTRLGALIVWGHRIIDTADTAVATPLCSFRLTGAQNYEFPHQLLLHTLSTTVNDIPTFLTLPLPGDAASYCNNSHIDRKSRQKLRALNERELIFELVKDICNNLEIRSLCQKILQNVSILTDADKGSLFLVRGEKGDPNRLCTKGRDDTRPEGIHWSALKSTWKKEKLDFSKWEKKRKHINSFQSLNDVIHWSPSTVNVPSGEKTETHQFSPILERGHPLESFNYTRARPSCDRDRWETSS